MSIAIPEPIAIVSKTVDGLDLLLDVYAKEDARPSKPRPVIVFFHGGGFVAFNRKLVSPYIVQSALVRNWMLISVDYRLLPQVDGLEILSDITAAWSFVHNDLARLHPELLVDKEKVIVAGQSAATQVRPRPAAVLSIYGPPFVRKFPNPGKHKLPRSAVQHYFDAKVTSGWTPAESDPMKPHETEAIQWDDLLAGEPRQDDRGVLLNYLLQEDLLQRYMGEAPELDTLTCMTEDFPPTVIIHGTNDRFVPIESSTMVASRLQALGVPVRLITVPGADHAFDHWARATDTKNSNLWSNYLAPMFRYIDDFTSPNSLAREQTPGAIRTGFLDVAEALTPTIHEWTERPLGTVTFEPDPSTYFQCKAVHQHTLEKLSKLAWGKGDEFTLDFGSHRVGYFSFHCGIQGVNADAPARLRLTFGEIPFDVMEDLHPCKSWISTSWVPDETVNVDWCPTAVVMARRYSFRYVRIQVLDTSVKFKLTFDNIRVRAVSAIEPSTKVSPFRLQDGLLNRIDAVSIITLRDCMQTVFEDGPRRDRRLWLGDLRLQALTNYCTYRNFPLVRRCLYLFAAMPMENGAIPACIFEKPVAKASSDYIVDCDALFGSVVYDYTRESGDLDTACDLWDSILQSMKSILSYVDASDKFDCTRGDTWAFLDWKPELHKDAGMHGVAIFCCKAVNALARLLGKPPPYEGMVPKMTAAALTFFSKDQSLFVSGPQAQISWASNAWMALAGVLPVEQRKKALLATLPHPDAVKPLTPYLFHYFAEALAVSGAEVECLSLMKDYWGGMVEAGADTFWECYDPNDVRASPYGDCHNNSYCHAWSCTPSYLLRKVLKDYLIRSGQVV